ISGSTLPASTRSLLNTINHQSSRLKPLVTLVISESKTCQSGWIYYILSMSWKMDVHHTVKQLQRNKTLMWILLLNVVASVLHYVHNVMYFQHYPEPDWLSAYIVDYVWFLMTFVSLAGLAALINNKRN